MVEITKTVKLNVLSLTSRKNKILLDMEQSWLKAINHLFETCRFWDIFDKPFTRFNLQKLEYKHVKEFSGLQSQMVVDVIKDGFAIANSSYRVSYASPSYNIPRSADFASTKRKNPIMRIATLNSRIGVPITQDGAWSRFKDFLRQGWKTTHFRIKHTVDGWKLLMSISKDFKIKDRYDTIIGIDVGSRTLAAISVLDKEGNILKQLYFGRDIWNRQRDISIRRSKLTSYADKGNDKATEKLKDILSYESNFNKTRCYEIVNRIIDLAKEYNAFIAIEDLKGLTKSRLHRKANRKVKRMPFYKFRVALEQVAGQNNIAVVAINPAYTSQRCSKCGNIHESKSVLYKCPKCGFECNRDRNASVNIALVAGGFITIQVQAQTSKRNASVNRHVCRNDGIINLCQRHLSVS